MKSRKNANLQVVSNETTTYVSREAILALLSDAEVAAVSMAETASSLKPGQQFVDLENLDRGIQSAGAGTTGSPANVVPREAVSAETWTKIIDRLGRPA